MDWLKSCISRISLKIDESNLFPRLLLMLFLAATFCLFAAVLDVFLFVSWWVYLVSALAGVLLSVYLMSGIEEGE